MKATAQYIYERLIYEDRIYEQQGQIRFYLDNIDVLVKSKDVVGNILQEWTEEWMRRNYIDFVANPNTQMPPDFFLDPYDFTKDLFEVKAFNIESSPGFDIADFKAFVNELVEKPYHLDTDFLIYGYRMDSTGAVYVSNIWLEKIWQISRPMNNWPINVQYKNGIVHKMRPGVWYSNDTQIPIFRSLVDFLSAFEEMVFRNPETRQLSGQWKNNFRRSYRMHYGVDIDFPRWNDIKASYGVE